MAILLDAGTDVHAVAPDKDNADLGFVPLGALIYRQLNRHHRLDAI